MLLAAGIFLSAALVLYILVKPYPSGMVDGEQIVDPERMRLDAFDGAGYLMGLALGWFLERRLVHSEVTWPSHPEVTGSSRPEKTGSSRPEKTGSSCPEKTGSSRPEETGSSCPEKTGPSRPRETGSSRPEVTGPSEELHARILRGVLGTCVLAACNYVVLPPLRSFLDVRLYKFLYGFILYVLILFLLPWIFRRVGGKLSR